MIILINIHSSKEKKKEKKKPKKKPNILDFNVYETEIVSSSLINVCFFLSLIILTVLIHLKGEKKTEKPLRDYHLS